MRLVAFGALVTLAEALEDMLAEAFFWARVALAVTLADAFAERLAEALALRLADTLAVVFT